MKRFGTFIWHRMSMYSRLIKWAYRCKCDRHRWKSFLVSLLRNSNKSKASLSFFFVHSSSITWPDEQKVSINFTQLKLCYHDRPICCWTDQCRDNSRSTRHARWFTPLCPDAYSSSSRNTFFIRFKINVQYEVDRRKRIDRKKKKKDKVQSSCKTQHLVTESAVCTLAQSSWKRVTIIFLPVVYCPPSWTKHSQSVRRIFWLKRINFPDRMMIFIIKLSTIHPLRRCHHIDNDSACTFDEWNEEDTDGYCTWHHDNDPTLTIEWTQLKAGRRRHGSRSDQGAARAEGLRSEDSYGWSKSNAGRRRMDPNRMDERGRWREMVEWR